MAQRGYRKAFDGECGGKEWIKFSGNGDNPVPGKNKLKMYDACKTMLRILFLSIS